ncbi:MAG: hypothetical protein IKV17_07635 [Bacteroidaceae bacterium]|nr:hypothetical protein [Bacteroidaceae bacterium]
MIYDLNNEYEAPKFKGKVEKLLQEGATVELKKIHPKRSLAQNNYLHLILGFFGSEYGLSIEEVKLDIFKRECNADLFKRSHDNKKGVRIEFLRSTAELTTAEMTTAIERFRNWSAAVAGIYLPSANEHEFLLHCRRAIEENREFI